MAGQVDHPDRSLIGSIAANERWSRATPEQRRAGTEAARAARLRAYEDRVDPDRVLDPEELARRVSNLRRADMARLTRRSVESRQEQARRRQQTQAEAELDALVDAEAGAA